MDQNIESKILEKRKLCKVLKVFKIVSFIGIFAPFVASAKYFLTRAES